MHPKSEIRPDPEVIARILKKGWVGQLKIHGHRAQIHVPADDDSEVLAYTRQGKPHTKLLPPKMLKELKRLFRPKKGWNVIDTEWLKPKDKMYVFDFVVLEGESLGKLKYGERWNLLPRDYISPHLVTLPLLKTVEDCMKALSSPKPNIEGLVFKSTSTPGFVDTSIVRCRRRIPRS